MRIFFLCLLLVVGVDGGIFKDLIDKIKGSIKTKLQKDLNVTLNLYKKLKEYGSKVKNMLKLTPKMLKSLKEKLKKVRLIVRDKIAGDDGSIDEINEKSGVGEYLYQGDMILSEKQAEEILENIEEETSGGARNRTKRQAFKDSSYSRKLWSQGVTYFFDYGTSEYRTHVADCRRFSLKQQKYGKITPASISTVAVAKALLYLKKKISKRLKILVPGIFTANDRLRVVAQDGCWSYVGKNGGEQSLSLGRGCEHVGVAVHELGHALGFFHTMSRYDRDAYITVIERNIKSGWRDQFTKESPQTNYNYGFGYDYGSVMHYGSHSAAMSRNLITMMPNDKNYLETLGSHILSFIDIFMMNEHYGCRKKCKPEFSAKCKNGGFPHPRNCSRCICPSGYGGALCNERPHGCGAELQATSNWQKLQDTLGFGREIREDFEFCNYWIKSPDHSQIEVKIVNPPKGVAVDGCYLAGVEIKTNRDQTHTGY
ncbi:astacin, partial [Necator americanus]